MASLDEARLAELAAWVVKAGLKGLGEAELLIGFCTRARTAGLPITRAVVVVDTLHPVHEGRAFRWRNDQAEESLMLEYGRTNQGGDVAESWRRSPFYTMLESGESSLYARLTGGDAQYPVFEQLWPEGQTAYLALIHRFADDNAMGELDCIYSSWVTDDPSGFSPERVDAFHRLVPCLALAIKSASFARIAATLVETYLGRDAGRRVLSGRIERGVADRIEAVLWFSDLRSYTRITAAVAPDQIIPFLNDYAEAIVSAVHDAGGDVLKLIGDGTLAIFTSDEPEQACRAALRAEQLARENVAALNERRAGSGLPITQAYLGLHAGEVFYGNVGSRDRLDFTVVGPAVNEASRIAALCRSVDRDVLVSSEFRAAASVEDRACLVSVGRYALRGIERPQELFTRDRDPPSASSLTAEAGGRPT